MCGDVRFSGTPNGVGSIVRPTVECHRGLSACGVFCWLFACFSIFSSWGIIVVLL